MSLRRPTWAGLAALAAGTVLLGYYAWTASSSGNPFDRVTPFQFKYGDSDYYNLQADAFLHGQLPLRVPVDPALEHAANPYDPKLPQLLPDGSFYNGRYYLTWGPGPAITLSFRRGCSDSSYARIWPPSCTQSRACCSRGRHSRSWCADLCLMSLDSSSGLATRRSPSAGRCPGFCGDPLSMR